MRRIGSSWRSRLDAFLTPHRSSSRADRRLRSGFHNRRIAVWIGGGVAAAFLVIAVLLIRRPAIDFRWLPKSAGVGGAELDAKYRETRWYELGPKDWDPYKTARELRRAGKSFDDSDPRAAELLKKLRDIWDNAPVNPALDGAAVRIPRYVVPLEESKSGMTEFLLVPYFGACIHTPPPPSNQILHVTASRPVENLHSMDNVWISGHLNATRSDSSMGMSSYAMTLDLVQPYVRPVQ